MADEPEMIDEEEALTPSTAEECSALVEKLQALKARCDAAGIEFQQDMDDELGPYAAISIPAGKAKRKIGVFSEDKADRLLSISFEKYKFLAGYEAIYCTDSSVIEVALLTTRMNPKFILQRMNNLRTSHSEKPTPIEICAPENLHGRPSILIGPCSPEFYALSENRSSAITLKMTNARSTQHDQAVSELRSYSDSLFFQVDLLIGATFILERWRRGRLSSPMRKRTELNISYPIAHYKDEAMSLYWYAKSARDMPLLRFLAFYQSIEFYFPRYSQTEARKRVGSIIKNPTFRPHRDDDLDRLISAIQRSGGHGSERSQLRAVVSECISAEQMRQYIVSLKDREEHFSGKNSKSKYHKIPVSNKNLDLRNDVADRIYDIRCKIVHTKNEHSEDDIPMILPFSEDADYLLHDIDLVEFVAQSVLVSSCGELN